MAIPSSNISLQAIQAEVGHSTTSNISLQAQSTNAPEHGSYTLLNDSPYGMNEFSGYEALSLGSFPNLSSGYSVESFSSSSNTPVSTNFNYRKTHASAQYGIQVGCYAQIGFQHDSTNNRIRIKYYSGTNAAFMIVYYHEITYIGLGSATWTCNYEYPDRTTVIPTLTSGNGNPQAVHPNTSSGGNLAENTYHSIPTSGYRFFYHQCTANYSSFNDNGQARLRDAADYLSAGDNAVRFNVRATLSGTNYTVQSAEYDVDMIAQRGFYAP